MPPIGKPSLTAFHRVGGGRPVMSIGIDPGANGAIVGIEYTTRGTKMGVFVQKTPETEKEMLQAVFLRINPWRKTHRVIATIELVGGFMGTDAAETQALGGKRNLAAAHQMFKFGHNYGGWRMALTAAGLVLDCDWFAVRPQDWTKTLEIPVRNSRKESRTQWKQRLVAEAKERFSGFDKVVINQTADALLIAEAGYHLFGKKPDA